MLFIKISKRTTDSYCIIWVRLLNKIIQQLRVCGKCASVMHQKEPCNCKVMENNTFHARKILKGRKREKEGFMHIVKYISVSRLYLPIGVSISDNASLELQK